MFLSFIKAAILPKKSVAQNEVKITYQITRKHNEPVIREIKIKIEGNPLTQCCYLIVAACAVDAEREQLEAIYTDYKTAKVLFIDSPVGRIAPKTK